MKLLAIKTAENGSEDTLNFDRLLKNAKNLQQQRTMYDSCRVIAATQVVSTLASPKHQNRSKRKTHHVKLRPEDVGFSQKFRCNASVRPTMPEPDAENEATLKSWLQDSNEKSSGDKPSNDQSSSASPFDVVLCD